MAKGFKTGGRKAGTPNREENPIKPILRANSISYFSPSIQQLDDDGKPTGRTISEFDRDFQALDPRERVSFMLKALEFTTPKLKAIDLDASATVQAPTLEAHLRALLGDDADI